MSIADYRERVSFPTPTPTLILGMCILYIAVFRQTEWLLNDELLHFVFGVGIYHGLVITNPLHRYRLTHRNALVAVLIASAVLESYKWIFLGASETANMTWFIEDLILDTVLALYAVTLADRYYT